MVTAIYWRNPNLEAELRRAQADVVPGGGPHHIVLLGTIHGPLNAEVARGVLEEDGVDVMLRGNTVGTVWGLTIGRFGLVQLYVRAADAERAHQILSELRFDEYQDLEEE